MGVLRAGLGAFSDPRSRGCGELKSPSPDPCPSTAASIAVHDLSAGSDILDRIGGLARGALADYDGGADASIELLNVSENATFSVRGLAAGPAVLRVHRLGYHDLAAIESELAWMSALRTESVVRTPAVIPTRDGRRVVSIKDQTTGAARHGVMFEFLPGAEPEANDADRFEQLGRLAARMHGHTRSWSRPSGFTRFRWDIDAAFGRSARWGRWQDGVGVGRAEQVVLERLERTLRGRLESFGTGVDRFGLVHADTRLANLLVDEDQVSVIDFDDCGFSWYLYDLGTSVSFFEHEPYVPELLDRWLTGYRLETELPPPDEEEVWTFVLFRRLLLVAWIGTHRAADMARRLGAGYTEQSCELAERYLGRFA
jgi:Ser/Thr protein kinase RdoA (MazF antagonist)